MKSIRIFLVALAAIIGFMAPSLAFAQADIDKISPSDVNVLKGIPGDSFVSLEWKKATDNVGIEGYKIYYGSESVTNKNATRYEKTIDAGNVAAYIIGGLENSKTYYFAVTAYDKAGNESEYFSPEVSSTPMSGLVGALTPLPSPKGSKSVSEEQDDEAKTLKMETAEAVDFITVKIVFSAEVILPDKDIENYFTIVDNQTLESLAVKSAKFDKTDETNKTILLRTDIQIPETEYFLTVGNALAGKNNEIIVSGKNDTGVFKGSALEHIEEEAEVLEEHGAAPVKTDAPESDVLQLKSVVSVDEVNLKAVFNKKIMLAPDPAQNFEIIESSAPDKKLEIQEITLEEDGLTVAIKTTKPENKTYLVVVKGVFDESGEAIDENANKLEYSPLLPDTTPPEDVTNFFATVIKKTIAKLGWTASLNTAKDLIDQILYKSTNSGTSYSKLKSLGANTTSYNASGLVPGKEYYFKLTVKDKAGNESEGAITSVKIPELPATGPGGLLALAIGSAGIALIRKFGRNNK